MPDLTGSRSRFPQEVDTLPVLKNYKGTASSLDWGDRIGARYRNKLGDMAVKLQNVLVGTPTVANTDEVLVAGFTASISNIYANTFRGVPIPTRVLTQFGVTSPNTFQSLLDAGTLCVAVYCGLRPTSYLSSWKGTTAELNIDTSYYVSGNTIMMAIKEKPDSLSNCGAFIASVILVGTI